MNYKPLILLEDLILTFLLVFASILDSEFSAASFWRFDLVICALALLIMLPGALSARRKSAWGLLLSFNLALLILPFTCFSSSKSFIQLSGEIHTGMAATEVESVFEAHYPPGGRFPRPEAKWEGGNFVRYFMDPSHDRVDSISVQFQNGRVVKSKYLGD